MMPEHPHELYEVAVWVLGVLVLAIGSIVSRLWFNHQHHTKDSIGKLYDKIESARQECRDLIRAECDRNREDLKAMMSEQKGHGERIAALEAK